MTRLELENAQAYHLRNDETKKGVDMFEKYVGRIEWLHPVKKHKITGGKKYIVTNKDGEVVYEADKLSEIAKEFCVSVSRVSACINAISFLNDK